LLLALAASAAPSYAQTPIAKPVHKPKRTRPTLPAYNVNTVFLDPAHGGSDSGSSLGPNGSANALEKDLNRALAERIRSLLAEKNFTTVLSRPDSHIDSDVPADQRAEAANRARPVACIVLHATTVGRGLHIFTSALTMPPNATAEIPRNDEAILQWDSAQAAFLPRSIQLSTELATAFNALKVPVITGRASIAPIDSLTCPALILEVAPPGPGTSIADEDYQQHIAEAVLTALTYWRDIARNKMEALQASQQPLVQPANTEPTPLTKPAAKPRPEPLPRPLKTPEESPLAPDSAPSRPPPGGNPR
jgi:N-acetylmuramoyl-L-alanine amidase